MRQHRSKFYYAMVCFTVMVWGTAYPAVRYLAVTGVDPYLTACMRVLFPFMFAAALLICSREKLDIPALRKNLLPICGMSVFGSAGFLVLMALGLSFSGAGKSALLIGCNPIYIVLLSALILKEPLGPRRLAGVIIAIVGVVFTEIGADIVAGHSVTFQTTDLILLTAGVFWAIYSLLSRYYGHNLTYYQCFFWMFAISSLLIMPLFLPRAHLLLALSGKQLFWLAYCGLIPGGFCYLLWNRGLNVLGASVCGMMNSMLPVWSALFAVIFLNERMAWLQMLGGLVVIGGVLLGMINAKLPVNYETGHSLSEAAEGSAP